MRANGKRRLVELLKDVLIVVLALTAIYQAFRVQAVTFALQGGWLGSIIQAIQGGRNPILGSDEPEEPREVPVYPARIVVTNSDLLRYGVQYDNAGTDELFSSVFSVLGEALSVADAPQRISERAWRSALTERPGVYFDFLGHYPLETLLSWLDRGGHNAALTGSARRVLLAENGAGGVGLYYHNESDGSYYACGTSGAVLEHLLSAVEGWGSNGLKYAFEYSDTSVFYNLDPYILLDSTPPDAPVFHAETALVQPTDQDQVWTLLSSMKALGFYSQTATPYQAGGEWVVNEGADQLRISSGTIRFRTDDTAEPRYRVPMAGEQPTATELLDTVQPIVAGSVGASCGAARLYLIALEQLPDGSWQADFGYSLNGAAVQLYGEKWAARFLLRDGAIVEYILRFRSYSATGETALLTPERQTAAGLQALGVHENELVLCYEDTGADTTAPIWIAQ